MGGLDQGQALRADCIEFWSLRGTWKSVGSFQVVKVVCGTIWIAIRAPHYLITSVDPQRRHVISTRYPAATWTIVND